MESKKVNLRQIIIVSAAVFLLLCLGIGKLFHKSSDTAVTPESLPATVNESSAPAEGIPQPPVYRAPIVSKTSVQDEDSETLKRMMEDMEKDREQEKRIRDLKMQKEEVELEVAEQQSISELNKLKKDNIDSISDSDTTDASNMDIKIVYLGGTDTQREAILSINGIDYSVKEKDRPLKNLEIKSITNSDVAIHFLSPKDITTVYQYKSE